MKAVANSINNDPHEAVGRDAVTTAVHRNAEKFDKNAEAFFTYLQIFSAIFDSFAHGANDVANAVGPFATIYVVYTTGVVSSKASSPFSHLSLPLFTPVYTSPPFSLASYPPPLPI